MAAIGLDVGGTKIETQAFGPDWQLLGRSRCPTPSDYAGLLAAIRAEVEAAGLPGAAVGISAAGAVDRRTGLAVTANLPASGKPFAADLAKVLGRPVTFVNDARALALSEARLGAGRGASCVFGMVLGTGLGGAVVRDGRIEEGASGLLGELGHTALPGPPLQRHALPVLPCGCGRAGCAETLLSGPGLIRLAELVTGQRLSPAQIGACRATDPGAARVWAVWCALMAELLVSVTLLVDPDVVVLGGGVSAIAGLAQDLQAALAQAHLPGFEPPRIVVAEGGDATGARGAALAAAQQAATA